MVTMVASSRWPMTGPNLLCNGVCGLSTMICERLANPFSSLALDRHSQQGRIN